MTTRSDVIAEARGWIGVPWRHQGRTRLGVDCAGHVILVARALGLGRGDHLPNYRREPIPDAFIAAFAAEMDSVRLDAKQPGDAVVLADDVYPCHCGFLSEKNGVLHLVHASARLKQVVEEPWSHEWPGKLRRVFAFRGLSEAVLAPGAEEAD